jgi:hypothetical protein
VEGGIFGLAPAARDALEVLYATASATDATLASTTLNWADGDASAKSATLNLAADAQDEDLELLMVRLVDPRGGADIAYPDTAQVTIADSGKSARLRLLESAPLVDEARAKAYVTLTRRGSPSGEVRASYRTVAGGTYTGATATQGDLVWSDGDVSAKTITVPLNPATLPAGQSGTFNMEVFNATNASLETGAGASVSVLPLTVTVRDSVAAVVVPNPPAPPAPSSRSGGGGTNPLLLLALAVLLSVSRSLAASERATRSSRSAAHS